VTLLLKFLNFVKNKVTKNMIMIKINRENNDPEPFCQYNKIEPNDEYVLNEILLKVKFIKN